MTRRSFLAAAPIAAVGSADAAITVPLLQLFDKRANCTPEELRQFSTRVWPQAVSAFDACGIRLSTTVRETEVRRSPSDQPVFSDLDRTALNMVLTDLVQLRWDLGRGLAGLTTRYQGYYLCVIAVRNAHRHMFPFVAVNTCVHEILHALLLDVYEARPDGLSGEVREARIDAYATRLWLLHDCAAIRDSARVFVDGLARAGQSSR